VPGLSSFKRYPSLQLIDNQSITILTSRKFNPFHLDNQGHIAGSFIPLVSLIGRRQGEDREYPPFVSLFDWVEECSVIKHESPVIHGGLFN
jgi:hypothetical protein